MELLIGHRAIRTNVVEAWDARLSSHFVDQLGLPEEHWVPLILRCFFLHKEIKIVSVRLELIEEKSRKDAARKDNLAVIIHSSISNIDKLSKLRICLFILHN